MSATPSRWMFPAACVLAIAVGAMLGGARVKAPEKQAAAKSGERGHGGGAKDLLERVNASAQDAALTPGGYAERMLMLRRTLASCETEALWELLEYGTTLEKRPEWDVTFALINELIDRQGWGAWERVLRVESGARQRVAGMVLYQFSRRDPWKAYEEWQQHRAEFDSATWGDAVISEVSLAAAKTSADKLVEVFRQIPQVESNEMMSMEFAPDFDFRKLLDHLAGDNYQPYTASENTLGVWAERSPLEAAEWLVAHPNYLDREYREGELQRTLEGVAKGEMDEEARREAFELLARVKPEEQKHAWEAMWEESEGKISADYLRAADLTGRREDYLRIALYETRGAEELDPSWAQVPLAERQEILATVERQWAEKHPTVVEAKARERWGRMVRQAWGMGE
ncbi:hypothetical protein OJ996_22140 [Luteolibacter sp. GHJ8]|uniref:HEAT repeat domain-containing protein n=1 Tax=Luteolibacter rhizosphaerae TaxID=2989719 RepID=A0ABT3G9X8_9BACT|nr:hypothetical protein [Luteolibacter rhizosphaerae]MCW1916306.1 hypothetical protein [Luteolibacter rhizosphaerae]